MSGPKERESLLDNRWAMGALVLAYASVLYWPLDYLVRTYLYFAFFYQVPLLQGNPFLAGGLLFALLTVWEVTRDVKKGSRYTVHLVTKYELMVLTIIRLAAWGMMMGRF